MCGKSQGPPPNGVSLGSLITLASFGDRERELIKSGFDFGLDLTGGGGEGGWHGMMTPWLPNRCYYLVSSLPLLIVLRKVLIFTYLEIPPKLGSITFNAPNPALKSPQIKSNFGPTINNNELQ